MLNSNLYIAILPVVILLVFIYKNDLEKEPRGLLARLFVFGLISAIPSGIIEVVFMDTYITSNLPSFLMTFISVFITVALVEEFGKWIVTYLYTYRRKEFNHMYDGIVYSVFASLGFAAIENVLYIFQYGFDVGVERALLAVPGHAVDGVFMGILFSLSKRELIKNNNKKSLLYLILSIMVPSIIHGIYDGLIIYYTFTENETYLFMFIIYVIISYIVSLIAIFHISKINKNFDNTSPNTSPFDIKYPSKQVVPPKQTPVSTDKPCFYCGAPVIDGKCSGCGKVKR